MADSMREMQGPRETESPLDPGHCRIVHVTFGLNVRDGEPMKVITSTELFPSIAICCASGFTSVLTEQSAVAAQEFAMCTMWL